MALSTTKTVKIFLVILAFIVLVNIVRQSSILNTNSKVSLQNTKDTDFPFKKIRSVQYSTAIQHFIITFTRTIKLNLHFIIIIIIIIISQYETLECCPHYE